MGTLPKCATCKFFSHFEAVCENDESEYYQASPLKWGLMCMLYVSESKEESENE